MYNCTCNLWILTVKRSEFVIVSSLNMMNYQLSGACRHLSGIGFEEMTEEQLCQRRKSSQDYTEIWGMHRTPKKLNAFNLSKRI